MVRVHFRTRNWRLAMALVGWIAMKKLVSTLVDEVYDAGDFLLVRNRGDDERVALSRIVEVSAATYINPARIMLGLAYPGPFGEEIVVSPNVGFNPNPFAKNPIAEDLIARVSQARSQRSIARGRAPDGS
jgi:hypothetical protein